MIIGIKQMETNVQRIICLLIHNGNQKKKKKPFKVNVKTWGTINQRYTRCLKTKDTLKYIMKTNEDRESVQNKSCLKIWGKIEYQCFTILFFFLYI